MKFEGLVQDDTQNYVLENEGYQNLTHTVITFRRALETCDPRDVPLTVRTSLANYVEHNVGTSRVQNILKQNNHVL